MDYDRQLIAGKLRRWEKYLLRFHLPAWEEIPNFGLYMEQVVDLLKEYLDYMPPELKEEQVITGAAINNYVRRKFLPSPCKKRYYRIHIAYLIMICTLKQSLSMTMIQRLLPEGEDEAAVRSVYETFAARHTLSAQYFVEQVRLTAAEILEHEKQTEFAVEKPEELIASAAIIAGLSQLLAEKLILLDGKTVEDVSKAGIS